MSGKGMSISEAANAARGVANILWRRDDMTRTGRFVEGKALKQILKLVSKAGSTVGLSSNVWDRLGDAINRAAEKLGLPKVADHYGLDPTNGEILAQ